MNDSTAGGPAPDLDRPESHGSTRVSIRRAPKLGVFIVFGALAGLLATLFVTGLYPADPRVGFAALFGYFALYGVPAGILLGAVIGLVVDAVSRRRAKTVVVEREVERAPAAPAAPPEPEH
ncbi:hypothetical protein [Homoserinibacter sp. YIM 151385]|uniref:hypothetical protein n=1 Tax=Homoserinibacter sp. YIM 151385 TaxID=2985506 RepID=UPI0022F00B1F|nr:hypothetical protein [Homoserinibacter sp. YIM 151385]WBU37381.1 hypothetical protein OF852_10715 [Homoserinibacter sp. YIM 151385]